jgi:MFS family permease
MTMRWGGTGTKWRGVGWNPRRGGAAGITLLLSATLWLNWSSTYYLLTVLAKPMASDTGWSLTFVVAGLSIGLVVAGLASPSIGRAIERRGGRPLLVIGSCALAIGLVMLAEARAPVTYIAAWIVLGIGMAAGLYDAAFAAIGRLFGLGAKTTIGNLVLIVGLAMTASWPFTALLTALVGWRGACLCYAALHLGLGLPLHFFLFPPLPQERASTPDVAARSTPAAGLPRGWLVWAVASNVTLSVGIGSVIAVHLVTLLQGLGLRLGAAVGLGSLIWLSQGTGRFLETALRNKIDPVWEGIGASLLVLAGLALLMVASGGVIPLALVVFGIGNGIRTIVKGTLPLVLFGGEGYARLIGLLGMPTLIAQAAGPALGALALTRYGTAVTLDMLAALALVNLALSYCLRLGYAPSRAATAEAPSFARR